VCALRGEEREGSTIIGEKVNIFKKRIKKGKGENMSYEAWCLRRKGHVNEEQTLT